MKKQETLLKNQSQQQNNVETVDPQAQQKLNEALARAASLERQLTKIQQDQMRSSSSNKYLDDTNARLRRQLQEMKADEQVLVQQNKELSAENRKLLTENKSRRAMKKTTTARFVI